MSRVALVSGMIAFRLAVTEVLLKEDREEVRMTVAHSNDPNDPNFSFSKYTPKADFYFTVTNPNAFGAFVPGGIYDLGAVASDSGLTLVAQSARPIPTPVTPVVVPAPVADPAPVAPASVAPVPTDPAPIDPPPVDPAPAADPAPVDPAPVDPAPAAEDGVQA